MQVFAVFLMATFLVSARSFRRGKPDKFGVLLAMSVVTAFLLFQYRWA